MDSPWMTTSEAAAFRRVSRFTIWRHRTPWTEATPPRGQWRYKLMAQGSSKVPRYWRADIEASFLAPEDF
jgi:hypothetical protein